MLRFRSVALTFVPLLLLFLCSLPSAQAYFGPIISSDDVVKCGANKGKTVGCTARWSDPETAFFRSRKQRFKLFIRHDGPLFTDTDIDPAPALTPAAMDSPPLHVDHFALPLTPPALPVVDTPPDYDSEVETPNPDPLRPAGEVGVGGIKTERPPSGVVSGRSRHRARLSQTPIEDGVSGHPKPLWMDLHPPPWLTSEAEPRS